MPRSIRWLNGGWGQGLQGRQLAPALPFSGEEYAFLVKYVTSENRIAGFGFREEHPSWFLCLFLSFFLTHSVFCSFSLAFSFTAFDYHRLCSIVFVSLYLFFFWPLLAAVSCIAFRRKKKKKRRSHVLAQNTPRQLGPMRVRAGVPE